MKNREQTEEKIFEAVGSIIENQGFEKVGINAIATEAGVSKMLIYRYFGGVEELIAQYLIQKDYWANTDVVIINPEAVGNSIKSMFRRQVEQLRNDITGREWVPTNQDGKCIDRLSGCTSSRFGQHTLGLNQLFSIAGRAVSEL